MPPIAHNAAADAASPRPRARRGIGTQTVYHACRSHLPATRSVHRYSSEDRDLLTIANAAILYADRIVNATVGTTWPSDFGGYQPMINGSDTISADQMWAATATGPLYL